MAPPPLPAKPKSTMPRTATGTVSMAAAEATSAASAASTIPGWRQM